MNSNRLKGELQCENKLISYERAFKMLEKDLYVTGIAQAVLELTLKLRQGITKGESPSEILENIRLVSLKMT